MTEKPVIAKLTVEITAAHASRNRVAPEDLAAVVTAVHAALSGLTAVPAEAAPQPKTATPAQVRRSITDDGLVSFIDGRSYKTLKLHLARHGLDAGAYRRRYGLPDDYPMIAPAYSEMRSRMAKFIGLGRQSPIKAARPASKSAPAPRR